MTRLVCLIALLGGCGRTFRQLADLSPQCASGSTQTCTCPAGAASTQTCDALGQLSACACDPVQISPPELFVSAGRSVRFTALVTGDTSGAVTWSAQRGSISSNGTYTAPADEGDDVVHAQSSADPALTGTAQVSVLRLPERPALTVPRAITASTGALTVSVEGPNPAWTYAWTVFGTALLTPANAPSVQLAIDQVGVVNVLVTATNAAGDAGPPAQALLDIVPALDPALAPEIVAPATVTAGRTHITVRVREPLPQLVYEWRAENGSVVSGGDGSARVTAADAGVLRLFVVGLNAAGSRTSEVEKSIPIMAAGALEQFYGERGGWGVASGGAADARFNSPRVGSGNNGTLIVVDRLSRLTEEYTTVARVGVDGSVAPISVPSGLHPLAAAERGDALYLLETNRFHRIIGGTTTSWDLALDYSDFVVEDAGHALLMGSSWIAHLDLSQSIAGDVVILGDPTDSGCFDGNGVAARFSTLRDLAFVPALTGGGDLYLADAWEYRVLHVTIDAAHAGPFPVTGVLGPACGGTDDTLYGISGISAGANRLHVTVNNVVHTMTLPSGSLEVQAGHTDGGYADGNGEAARFEALTEPVLLGDALYVADYNGVIRKLIGSAVSTHSGRAFSNPQRVSYNFCATTSPPALHFPTSLSLTSDARVRVADSGNCRIIELSPGGEASWLAGTGLPGSANGFADAAGLSSTIDALAHGADDTLYFSENWCEGNCAGGSLRHRYIRQLTPLGLVLPYAGSPSPDPAFVAVDDTGAAARFLGIQALAYEPSSELLFVADSYLGYHNAIRLILPDRTVLTLYGDPVVDEEQFETFVDVATGPSGSLFFTRWNSYTDGLPVVSKLRFDDSGASVVDVASAPGALIGRAGGCFETPFISNFTEARLAYDAASDTLYVGDSHVVWRLEPISDEALCVPTLFAGELGAFGVKLGPLPARLNHIADIALTPSRDLLILDKDEDVILLARP